LFWVDVRGRCYGGCAVLKSVDRGDFSQNNPYYDGAQAIGYEATISAPHMHAYALEYLKDHLQNGKRALDVGSGSGYLTVCFAKMMTDPTAKTYGVEHISQIVELSLENINKNHNDYITDGRVNIFEVDGRKGLSAYAPYDVIHVGAATEEIPKELIEQLAKGGRLLLPVGKPGHQDMTIVDKDMEGKISKRTTLGVTYIPLTSKEAQVNGRSYR